MEYTIVQIYNEQVYTRIKHKLIESEYVFNERIFEDSSFPVFNQQNIFGEIHIEGIIPTDYFIEEKDEINLTIKKSENNKEKTKKNYWMYFFVFYSVIATFMVIKYWHQNRKISGDKNYTYEWSFDGSSFSMKSRNENTEMYRYIDNNYDNNYETAVSFFIDGRIIEKSSDQDENGIYEVSTVESDGNLSSIYIDNNQDGFHETVVYILENLDTVFIEDLNGNGIYEVIKNSP